MSHNQRKPDACDMLAEALKQMDNLLSDTSHVPPLPQNGHISKLTTQQHNGRPSLDGPRPSMVNGGSGASTPTGAADGTLARRLQASKAVGLCAELRVTLAKLEDRAAFLQQLPAETRKFLQQWFSEMDKDGISDQSDGGMSPRGTDNMKLDLVVENNRLRLRLARMERELQGLEDKFSAAQRRISDLHSSLNERTVEVTGLTSRLARSAHTSPDRNGQHELEKLKRVVELLKIADNEKNSRIEELKQALIKYKKMEEVLVQLKKSQILENIQFGQDRNGEDIRSSGEEDGDSLSNNKTTLDSNNSPSDEALQDPAVHLRSLSAPRLAAATHQALSISTSVPLSSLNNFGDSSSSYDNLASYTTKALAAAKKENFGSHDALMANGSVVEPPSPVSPTEKRPPLPPHSTAAVSGQAATTHRRQNRVFASVGKGILKSQGNRWSRSTPSLLASSTSTTPRVEEEAAEGKKEDGVEEEDKDKPGSRSQTPTRIQTKKSQPSGLKKFFDKMKRRSQDLDDRLEDFKRSPLRSTVGARLGLSEEIYDVNQPFARWDTDRVALWLHVLGLSMYIGNCRRWVKNGEQLLKASNRDLEKELEIHNRFHRKKLQLALQAVTAEKRSPMSDLDHNWVARWLDDIGLPQYKDQFYEARIDGRLLNYLTIDELVQLKVTNAFHHLSFKRAIQVLRMNKFNQTCLIRRPASDDESPKNCPTEVMLWTNHRIMEWLRSIDLSEYAPNLRGSGVHGALMVLEPRFGAEVFATLLSIPASKTLLRRHLSTHFVTLVGNTIQMQKRELESRPGYTALATNQKIKLRRGIFKSDKPEEFICPMDVSI